MQQVSSEVTYQLNFPITYDNQEYKEVKLKRPKGKHIKGLPTEPTLDDLKMIAQRVTGLANAFFDELDASDLMGVSEVVANFLAYGRKTGNN